MPPFRADGGYPTAGHAVAYLADHEKRYDLPTVRSARVRSVHSDGARLRVVSDVGEWSARFVISATGMRWRPFVPAVAGAVGGRQLHRWIPGTRFVRGIAGRRRGRRELRRADRRSPTGPVWDGISEEVDAIIWCTGFRPALRHLASLRLGGHIATDGTRAVAEPRLHPLGYGDWTGPASATLIGVGPTARAAVREIAAG